MLFLRVCRQCEVKSNLYLGGIKTTSNGCLLDEFAKQLINRNKKY
jgi:hypothetical protein